MAYFVIYISYHNKINKQIKCQEKMSMKEIERMMPSVKPYNDLSLSTPSSFYSVF